MTTQPEIVPIAVEARKDEVLALPYAFKPGRHYVFDLQLWWKSNDGNWKRLYCSFVGSCVHAGGLHSKINVDHLISVDAITLEPEKFMKFLSVTFQVETDSPHFSIVAVFDTKDNKGVKVTTTVRLPMNQLTTTRNDDNIIWESNNPGHQVRVSFRILPGCCCLLS